ncbi:MAG: type II toxin-antitoxin system death-on-curing family toxin [Candidatus Thorarchaeota archaeon]|nr:type II toxin-antitoxin system death-on-curing family toxin [Candidatus Thorarchaeota archaeon]
MRIHEQSLERYGGESGILCKSDLVDCLEIPVKQYYGFDPYPSIWKKAAALLHCIIDKHPFVDGNKRTGWLTTALFLAFNGHYLMIDIDDAEDMCISIAKGEVEIDTSAAWLRKHAVSDSSEQL